MGRWLLIGLVLAGAGVGATQDAPAKREPRPEKSPAEAAAWAGELRAAYLPVRDTGTNTRPTHSLRAIIRAGQE
jgi:hypothetical protein